MDPIKIVARDTACLSDNDDPRIISLMVEKSNHGQRLDKFIHHHMDAFSRSHIHKLIEEGGVTFNNIPINNKSRYVKTDETYMITLPQPQSLDLEPENIPLDIYYEDDDVIVLEKPAGMVMHPSCGHDRHSLVHALLYHCQGRLSTINGTYRLGIVHRIDKDTSGIVICAKNDAAHQSLGQQFEARTIYRLYQAIIWGRVLWSEKKISTFIHRHVMDRKKMAISLRAGKTAISFFTVKERFKEVASLITCKLETGRTHQIRAHCEHLKHPLIGDKTYKKNKSIGLKDDEILPHFPRQALHAYKLGFIHPTKNTYMEFTSPFPDDFQALYTHLQKNYKN